jgi:hypothetical protein
MAHVQIACRRAAELRGKGQYGAIRIIVMPIRIEVMAEV